MIMLRIILILLLAFNYACIWKKSDGKKYHDLPIDWTENLALPIIKYGNCLKPKKEISRFIRDGYGEFSERYTYIGRDESQKNKKNSSPVTVEHGAELAMEFISYYFPEMRPFHSLEIVSILNGNRLHIGLNVRYHGINVGSDWSTLVFVDGELQEASIRLCTAQPLIGSEKKIISEQQARKIYSKIIGDKSSLLKFELKYIWDPAASSSPDYINLSTEMYTPNWCITSLGENRFEQPHLLIRAYSGNIWRDD